MVGTGDGTRALGVEAAELSGGGADTGAGGGEIRSAAVSSTPRAVEALPGRSVKRLAAKRSPPAACWRMRSKIKGPSSLGQEPTTILAWAMQPLTGERRSKAMANITRREQG